MGDNLSIAVCRSVLCAFRGEPEFALDLATLPGAILFRVVLKGVALTTVHFEKPQKPRKAAKKPQKPRFPCKIEGFAAFWRLLRLFKMYSGQCNTLYM